MDTFYRELPTFNETRSFFNEEHYQKVPPDWLVSVMDVRGSTQAIERGGYKDVNFIGAANITAFLQLLSPELPFSFGGDGATVLIKPAMRNNAVQILESLCYWARESFQLEVHAGIVEVEELRAKGADILIAKYQAYPQIHQALFSGGGLTMAESLIKNDVNRRVMPAPSLDRATLFSGLTCRWKPIPASRGTTLSLIIKPLFEGNALLREMTDEFETILERSLAQSNPINMSRARYRSFLYNLKRQIKISGLRLNKRFMQEILELFITLPVFNFGLYRLFSPLKNYVQKIPEHCDFQKYDDTLKMVLDCSDKEYRAIMNILENYSSQGRILFGAHTSDSAQLTCFVETVADGDHLHFVDGSNGGYAQAANMLKERSQKASGELSSAANNKGQHE